MGDGVVGGALLGAQGAAGPRLARAGTHTLVSRLPRASANGELNMYGFCRISQTGILHIPDNIQEFYSLFSLTASCMSVMIRVH